MIILSVNLNKIALLRNSRDTQSPSLIEFLDCSLNAGARGITVHPRPDQRHIRVSDVIEIDAHLRKNHPEIEFNIEGNPFAPAQASGRDNISDYPGFMALVEATRPAQCTLVPDGDAQLTSDHGFDLNQDGEKLRPIIEQLHQWGCRVSLFMDAIPEQVRLAKDFGADRIEFYTGPYADAYKAGQAENSLQQFIGAAEAAHECGLGINAGHDLDLHNLPLFSQLPHLLEVSIGHELTVDALRMGYAEAIRAYVKALNH